MARDAQDREDLMREASAYVQRVELRLPGVDHEVFCGFREGGAFSLYWGQDSVFQFNTDGELRRAFWQGRMVASYKRQLHWLERDAESEVKSARLRLQRTPFSETEGELFSDRISACLRQLKDCFASEHYELVDQFPRDKDVCQRSVQWLDQQPDLLRLAVHPGTGRKR